MSSIGEGGGRRLLMACSDLVLFDRASRCVEEYL